mmetsp:Transcript_32074/g.37719  ORF Transcript_32074/g.37719 Transcript_32074/m.37719 type:complete len:106 (+) Transcript_32074:171-488(+)
MLINPTLGSCCMGLNGCAMTCGGLAWWITGIVWRFSSDGAYAAGEIAPEGESIEDWDSKVTADGSLFQHHSGKFMFIYYILCWSLMGLSCLCSVCAAIAGCVTNK